MLACWGSVHSSLGCPRLQDFIIIPEHEHESTIAFPIGLCFLPSFTTLQLYALPSQRNSRFVFVMFVLCVGVWEKTCLAKASCASQIRTAKAVAEEMGPAAAAQSGVSKWANISDGHSERDVQHVAQQGSRLDVPISEMSACGIKIPWIRPVDWVQCVVDMGLTTMFAGVSLEQKHLAPQIWTEFWKK